MGVQPPWEDLPALCWEAVFRCLVSDADLESISSVCKQFLNISNTVRTRLSITNLVTPRLSSLLRRFTSLKSIDLSSFRSDPSSVLLQIAQFPLPLERLELSNQKSLRFDGLREMGSKFGALRVLVLYNVGLRGDADLVSIAECFPALEELEIKYPMQDRRARVTDDGICVLSRKLQRLSRINVSGNPFLTDQSLVVLSVNCPSLREVVFRGFGLITGRGVASLIVNRPHLVSLALSGMEEQAIFCEELVDSFRHARGLSSLDFSRSFIWDGLLMAVAEANIPLKRLVFSHSSGFSFDGIRKIVLKHRGIDDLDLVAVDFLTDRNMRVICEGLRSLTYIDVSECSNLTMRTLCDLMRQCPFLEGIEMMMTGLRKDDANETDIVVNSRVRYLRISTNVNLTDAGLKKIGRMCPGLGYLEVGNCLKITEDGILGVLKSCPEIRHLYIHEDSHAKDLKLNDEQLVAFISRCCNLKYLDLPNCVHLSTKGVEKVVKNCNRLREINLRDCHNVRDDVPFLDWMVSVRPSLRRIVPPRGVSSKIRDFFLQRGLSCRC
ncbi:hypothetical protein BT93_L4575 [Corymbia citriodora subsp. variegata]|uniref:Uncharacterized protein n=1 Tax=Corymbia citriodora subsp. variegata TaxID=360336 RepID=A0A8T0CXF6_CORYI|nr:hypothetical protein BT93_L4575 [Corymbia citriodora subsp. variegata]